ncbi:AI-2E family transporter [Microbacterium ulmi]|uniref:AI-2E family transporter n=1 Tax=Microbacterium ulmi TaxID=179095 RepID=A0A7Y2Q1Z7_9MICO|nr:AI-2E family transporter [Microbacterium ulmi]NII69497.1 putative PurR-regulated permease PerM [Microbacterium ulmi]NNH04902.1 AI-2E family transporter [Microbacterium ulmi]
MTTSNESPDPLRRDARAALAADATAGTDAATGDAWHVDPAPDEVAAPAGEAPASHTMWANVNHPFALGLFLTLGGLVAFALGVAFTNLSTVVIYIVFALFAALGLDPVVRWLEARGVKRAWGIVIVYTAFAVVLVAVLWLIIPTVVRQIAQFITDLPQMIADFEQTAFYGWLEGMLGDPIELLLHEIQQFFSNPANIAAIGGGFLQVGATIATTISGLIIILVLSLYFLASLPIMKQSFNRLAPARTRAKVAGMTDQITDSIGGYLMGMVILAFCNSIVTLILFLALRLPFPPLMAVVAFSLTLIPLVGSVLFWIVASVVALFANPLSALIFAILYLIYMQLEAYVLTPRVMNRTISVPGALVVIGALVGGTLLGLLGALVAIPVTASILLIIKQVVIPRQDAKV